MNTEASLDFFAGLPDNVRARVYADLSRENFAPKRDDLHSIWHQIHHRYEQEFDPAAYLRSCEKNLVSDWRYGEPLIAAAISHGDLAQAESFVERTCKGEVRVGTGQRSSCKSSGVRSCRSYRSYRSSGGRPQIEPQLKGSGTASQKLLDMYDRLTRGCFAGEGDVGEASRFASPVRTEQSADFRFPTTAESRAAKTTISLRSKPKSAQFWMLVLQYPLVSSDQGRAQFDRDGNEQSVRRISMKFPRK